MGLITYSYIQTPGFLGVLDFVGKITLPSHHFDGKTEYKFILSIIDTRWVKFLPMENASAVLTAKLFDDQWLCRYIRPRIVLSDQGINFKCKEFNDLFDSYGIKHRFTTSYNATRNSVERMHASIRDMIRITGIENWVENLQSIAFVIRAAWHSASNTSHANETYGVDMDAQRIMRKVPEQEQRDLNRLNKKRVPHDFNSTKWIFMRKP